MAEPTRADREAVWMAYWDDPVRDRCEMSRALHQWLHDGVMAAGAVDVTVRLQRLAEDRARQRTELLRLAVQVAAKVGEHEYARGRREGLEAATDHAAFLARTALKNAERMNQRHDCQAAVDLLSELLEDITS